MKKSLIDNLNLVWPTKQEREEYIRIYPDMPAWKRWAVYGLDAIVTSAITLVPGAAAGYAIGSTCSGKFAPDESVVQSISSTPGIIGASIGALANYALYVTLTWNSEPGD